MWVSPQSFSREWLDEFLELMKAEPAWLAGVVFGPQVRVSLAELRKAIPARSTRSATIPTSPTAAQCQYPVPDWDVAYRLTEGREVINPRPRDEATIFRASADQTIGFITYSEGCNDDVNKIVWSAPGLGPARPSRSTSCASTAAISIGDRYDATASPRGCSPSSENWRGPLLTNSSAWRRRSSSSGSRTAASRPSVLAELAVPAGPLSRLLRRLRAQPPDLRD